MGVSALPRRIMARPEPRPPAHWLALQSPAEFPTIPDIELPRTRQSHTSRGILGRRAGAMIRHTVSAWALAALLGGAAMAGGQVVNQFNNASEVGQWRFDF